MYWQENLLTKSKQTTTEQNNSQNSENKFLMETNDCCYFMTAPVTMGEMERDEALCVLELSKISLYYFLNNELKMRNLLQLMHINI